MNNTFFTLVDCASYAKHERLAGKKHAGSTLNESKAVESKVKKNGRREARGTAG